MSKIKQTKISPQGGLSAIAGAKPLTQIQCVELSIHNLMAFESLLDVGTVHDFEVIAALSNLVQIIDADYFYGRKSADIEKAQNVIKLCYDLSKKRGVYLLTADGIREVQMLLSLHELQLQQVTQKEIRKAVEHAQKLAREAYREVVA